MDPVAAIAGFALVLTIVALLLVTNEWRRGAADLKQFRLLAMANMASLFLLEMHAGAGTGGGGEEASSTQSMMSATVVAPYPWVSQREFSMWLLGLHVLYFGLSLETKRGLADWQTRILHGPSFGGAHSLLALGLWAGADWRGLAMTGGPVVLHQLDVRLGRRALQQAYSPVLGQRKDALLSAAEFAGFRVLLRLWSAGLGLPLLGFLWAVLRDPAVMENALATVKSESLPGWRDAGIAQAMCLAGSLAAYCCCTAKLFGEPLSPAMEEFQKSVAGKVAKD